MKLNLLWQMKITFNVCVSLKFYTLSIQSNWIGYILIVWINVSILFYFLFISRRVDWRAAHWRASVSAACQTFRRTDRRAGSEQLQRAPSPSPGRGRSPVQRGDSPKEGNDRAHRRHLEKPREAGSGERRRLSFPHVSHRRRRRRLKRTIIRGHGKPRAPLEIW